MQKRIIGFFILLALALVGASYGVATSGTASAAVTVPTVSADPGFSAYSESRAIRSEWQMLHQSPKTIGKAPAQRTHAVASRSTVRKSVAAASPAKTKVKVKTVKHAYAKNVVGVLPSAYTGPWYDPKYESVRRCIVQRESNGHYDAMNSQGYSGAYQFGTRGKYSWEPTIQKWTGEYVPVRHMSRYAQDYAFWRAWNHGAGKMHWDYPPHQCW